MSTHLSRSAEPLRRWRAPGEAQARLLVQLALDDVEQDQLTGVGDRVVAGKVDEALYRLLPPLYPHYGRAGLQHPGLPRIRDAYQRALVQGLLTTKAACDCATALAARGEPVMLLKGLSLAHLYYGDLGTRPMGDADLLVRDVLETGEIIALMNDAGVWSLERTVMAERALVFRHRNGATVDLHRYLDDHCNAEGFDRQLWEQAHRTVLNGVTFQDLRVEHQILHTVTHGIPYNKVSPFRWIVDVGRILARGPVEWDGVVDLAVHYRLTSTLATGLAWLTEQGLCPAVYVPAVDSFSDRAFQEDLVRPATYQREARRLLWSYPYRMIRVRGGHWSPRRHRKAVRDTLQLGDGQSVRGKALKSLGQKMRLMSSAERAE